jgi:hypothetical protein
MWYESPFVPRTALQVVSDASEKHVSLDSLCNLYYGSHISEYTGRELENDYILIHV